MPKTTKDWMGMISFLLTLASGVESLRLVPLAWLEGKSAWVFLFAVSFSCLICWAADHYIQREIIAPIREATAAFAKLEKSTTAGLSEERNTVQSLTTTVGNQHNRVEALISQISGDHEYLFKSMKVLLERNPPPPKTGV